MLSLTLMHGVHRAAAAIAYSLLANTSEVVAASDQLPRLQQRCQQVGTVCRSVVLLGARQTANRSGDIGTARSVFVLFTCAAMAVAEVSQWLPAWL
jgi:hypothetical protein